jgi:hypothetical protein
MRAATKRKLRPGWRNVAGRKMSAENRSGKRADTLSLAAELKIYLASGGRLRKFVEALYAAAVLDRDVAAQKLIFERIDGSLRQQFEAQLSGSLIGPIVSPTSVTILIPANGRDDHPASGRGRETLAGISVEPVYFRCFCRDSRKCRWRGSNPHILTDTRF